MAVLMASMPNKNPVTLNADLLAMYTGSYGPRAISEKQGTVVLPTRRRRETADDTDEQPPIHV